MYNEKELVNALKANEDYLAWFWALSPRKAKQQKSRKKAKASLIWDIISTLLLMAGCGITSVWIVFLIFLG